METYGCTQKNNSEAMLISISRDLWWIFFFVSELNAKDPILDQPINIGLPPKRKTVSYSVQKEKNRQNKQNPELERAARLHQCKYSWIKE